MPDIAWWPALAFAALGAWLDFTSRRLPNWLCAGFAIAAILGLVATQGAQLLPWALLHAVVALVMGMLLFRFGVIGGGDAKFYAAAAFAVPIVPAAGPLALLGWTSVSGLVLLLAMMVGRRLAKVSAKGSLLKGWEVPYGVAIAAGFGLMLRAA